MNTPFTPIVPHELPHSALLAGLLILTALVTGAVLDIRLLLRMRTGGWPLHPGRAFQLLHRPWHWTDAAHIALVMCVFIVTLLLAGQISDHIGVTLSTSASRIAVAMQNLATQGLALALVLTLIRHRRCSVNDGFGSPPATLLLRVRQGLYCYLAALPFIVITALGSTMIFTRLGLPVHPQPVIGSFIDASAPLWFKSWLVVTAIILAPAVEEIVFRGIFLPATARQQGIPLAVITVSLLFALIHGHPPAFAPLFVVGTALSAAYLYTGSILVPFFMHSIFNGVNVAILLLSGITAGS